MRGLIVLASISHLSIALTIPTYPNKRDLSAGIAIYSCTVPGTIALTFDDGPFIYTESVLDQLASAGFAATFFLNGYNLGNIGDYQSTLDRMINEGHQVASHTYGHPDLAVLNDYDVEQQMALLSNQFMQMIVLGRLGYKVVIADIDTDDWRYSSFGGAEPSLDAYNNGLINGGSIVLMHDVHQNTVDNILPLIIEATKRSGKRAVTVGECLGDPETNWYRGSSSGSSGTVPQTIEWNGTDSHNIPVVVHTPAPERLAVIH